MHTARTGLIRRTKSMRVFRQNPSSPLVPYRLMFISTCAILSSKMYLWLKRKGRVSPTNLRILEKVKGVRRRKRRGRRTHHLWNQGPFVLRQGTRTVHAGNAPSVHPRRSGFRQEHQEGLRRAWEEFMFYSQASARGFSCPTHSALAASYTPTSHTLPVSPW